MRRKVKIAVVLFGRFFIMECDIIKIGAFLSFKERKMLTKTIWQKIIFSLSLLILIPIACFAADRNCPLPAEIPVGLKVGDVFTTASGGWTVLATDQGTTQQWSFELAFLYAPSISNFGAQCWYTPDNQLRQIVGQYGMFEPAPDAQGWTIEPGIASCTASPEQCSYVSTTNKASKLPSKH
jgi:hypothetical protein